MDWVFIEMKEITNIYGVILRYFFVFLIGYTYRRNLFSNGFSTVVDDIKFIPTINVLQSIQFN